MNNKLVFLLALVALLAVTNAKPQGGEVNVVNGENQVNVVDGGQQIQVVDGTEQGKPGLARGGEENR